MDRGLDQFLFLIFIVAASLIDLIVRRLRRRQETRQPPPTADAPGDTVPWDSDARYAEEEPEIEFEWPEPVPPPQEKSRPVPAAPEARSLERPVSVVSLEQLAFRQPLIEVRSARPTPQRRDRRRARRRRRFADLAQVRRAIVDMTILGPCRGSEPYR